MAHRPARGRMDTGVSLRVALRSTATGRRGTKVLQSLTAQRPGLFSQITRDLFRVAKGQANIPLPGVGMAGRALQIRSIGRQQLARVPFVAKVGAAAASVFGVERAIEVTTGRSPARMVFDLTQQIRRGRPASDTRLGGTQPMKRSTPMAGESLQHVMVNQWQTFPGGPIFSRFADGHIEVTKKNGTIRHYRPYRPVVIPKKWDARAMRRVATALKRQRKTATKILQLTGGVPKRQERAPRGVHKSVDV